MKKTNIALALAAAMALSVSAAEAATLVAGNNYDLNILVGDSCFTFGNCSTAVAGSISYLVDNDNDAIAAAGSANTGFGSAIAGDSKAGIINITTTDDGAGGVNFTVNSFNVDTYNGTSGGQFATQGTNVGTMSGSIDSQGVISFDPTGRDGMAQFFNTSLGQQPWNTGSTFTSGSQTNAVGTLTGQDLALDGSAKIVSASAVGAAWGFFVNTPYTEVFQLNVTGGPIIASPVPVPAAVWLFGSGLLGLVGVARRKKQAV